MNEKPIASFLFSGRKWHDNPKLHLDGKGTDSKEHEQSVGTYPNRYSTL